MFLCPKSSHGNRCLQKLLLLTINSFLLSRVGEKSLVSGAVSGSREMAHKKFIMNEMDGSMFGVHLTLRENCGINFDSFLSGWDIGLLFCGASATACCNDKTCVACSWHISYSIKL